MKKKILTMLIVIMSLAMICLVGCNSEGVEGTYKLYYFTYEGNNCYAGQTYDGVTIDEELLVIELGKDGQAKIKGSGISTENSWNYDKENGIITIGDLELKYDGVYLEYSTYVSGYGNYVYKLKK